MGKSLQILFGLACAVVIAVGAFMGWSAFDQQRQRTIQAEKQRAASRAALSALYDAADTRDPAKIGHYCRNISRGWVHMDAPRKQRILRTCRDHDFY